MHIDIYTQILHTNVAYLCTVRSRYVPKGHAVRLVNKCNGWLECLTLSAPDTRA